MSDQASSSGAGFVADTMVLGMFVDAGYTQLLTDLAAGNLIITPAIINPAETPPYASHPMAEFAAGTFLFQQRLGNPLDEVRFSRRAAYYLDINLGWNPAALSIEEIKQQEMLSSGAIWEDSRVSHSGRRNARIGRGEAECAAVAISRGLTLWSDDAAIVSLLAVLHPDHPVERISDLVIRAAREEHLSCQEAADLYNDIFKQRLGLWSNLTLVCRNGQVTIR